MAKYIALLKGINVGGHVVKMDRLRDIFTATRFRNVETLIASGNVIFEATGAEEAMVAKIEKALKKELGYAVPAFIRTPAELTPIAATEESGEGTLSVGFLTTTPDPALSSRITALSTPDDDLEVKGREIYWLNRKKISDSKISYKLIEKTLGQQATFRNINTIRRLIGLIGVRS
ncbi:MAG: DUF1697 domain-containing protein [Thermoanaerobaculia bacterium]|nr:DUF1697 domain-containing protein [Thermoanaerobaculia bacterium]